MTCGTVPKGFAVLLFGAWLALGTAGVVRAEPVKYSVPQGVSVTSVKTEMKPEDGRQLCFVSVSVKNETGQDQLFEIELAGDDGLLITTFTGGPKKSPLKAGTEETTTFKTLLTQPPKQLEVTVRPYSE